MSHYNPALGGVNCANFVNGECISHLAGGGRWQDYMNKNVIACPQELNFGTKIVIDEKTYECRDRGGAVVYDGNAYWVDVLTDAPEYRYGEVVKALLVEP